MPPNCRKRRRSRSTLTRASSKSAREIYKNSSYARCSPFVPSLARLRVLISSLRLFRTGNRNLCRSNVRHCSTGRVDSTLVRSLRSLASLHSTRGPLALSLFSPRRSFSRLETVSYHIVSRLYHRAVFFRRRRFVLYLVAALLSPLLPATREEKKSKSAHVFDIAGGSSFAFFPSLLFHHLAAHHVCDLSEARGVPGARVPQGRAPFAQARRPGRHRSCE